MTIDRIEILERAVRRQRLALIALSLGVGAVSTMALSPRTPAIIDTHALRILDAQGRPRILLGAPTPNEGRVRKDGQTASLVVLGPDGKDRVIVGEAPNPVLNGKTYPRIAASYGTIIHNQQGQERGGMAWLDNGRGVVALDRTNADAVALIVNEQSGFAGLTVNYAAAMGKYTEGVRIGTKEDVSWLALSDRTEAERARLAVEGAGAPSLSTKAATK